jgi:PAS domain S-box-containing protein
MDGGLDVLVCGSDAAAVGETATTLEADDNGFEVYTVDSETSVESIDHVDCVVSLDVVPPVFVAELRQQRPSVPVIGFGAAGSADVTDALADGVTDYVQADGDEAHVVLAHRIEQAVETASDAVTSAAGFDRYTEVLGALADGVYALDDEGKFVFVNDAMTELTGYTAEELLGEHTRIVKDPATVTLAEEKLAELLSDDAREEVGTTFELELRPKDGGPIPCEDHMTVLRGPDGEFRGTAGVIRDITDRKRREEMLSGLQETSRELVEGARRERVTGVVADAAGRVVGLDLNVVRL